MASSDRKKQQKLSARQRKKEREEAKRQAYAKTEASLADFRKKSASVKASLKRRGYQQTFYDYLDDYREAFERIARTAQEEHPSLVGVHELDDDDYYSPDTKPVLAKFGCGDLTQIFVTATGVGEEYLQPRRRRTVTGNTTPLKAKDGSIRTVIFIRRSIETLKHPQIKYLLKIPALFHEIGHVDDWERGINMKEGRVAMIDAEIYAHEYAFRKLMGGDFRASLESYLAAIEDLRGDKDYGNEIATRLIDTDLFRQCQEFVKTNWADHLESSDSTTQQGFAGIEGLSSMSIEQD